jgi:YfiH family protein
LNQKSMKRLEAETLAGLPGIAHGFFGREGGVSTGLYASLNCGPGSKDDREAVRENRRRIGEALAPGARLVSLAQIHSPFVHLVGPDWDSGRHPEGDGLVTATPGLALGILTADCGPVLFADAEAGVIGAAHAGWKGALGGVLEATITAMESLGAARERISAAIGPCISALNYEVGHDFRARFLEADSGNARFFRPGKPEHYHFNLEGYVEARLAELGLKAVEPLGVCTYPAENGYFSFRRTTHAGEPDYGREISAILLTK